MPNTRGIQSTALMGHATGFNDVSPPLLSGIVEKHTGAVNPMTLGDRPPSGRSPQPAPHSSSNTMGDQRFIFGSMETLETSQTILKSLSVSPHGSQPKAK